MSCSSGIRVGKNAPPSRAVGSMSFYKNPDPDPLMDPDFKTL